MLFRDRKREVNMDKRRSNRRGRNFNKRSAAGLVAAFMLLAGSLGAAGCGNAGDAAVNSGNNTEEGVGKNESVGGSGGVDAGDGGAGAGNSLGTGEKVMGRYVETVNNSMEDLLNAGSRIVRQEDGSLVIFSTYSGKWVSEDGGDTWEPETVEWFDSLKEEKAYIMDIAVAEDGTVGVIYTADTEPAEGEDGEENEGTKEERTGDGSGEDGYTELRPQYMVVSPDGTVTEFEIPYEPSGYLRSLVFSNDGRLFGAALDGKMYEIDWEQGESRVITELDEGVDHFRVWDGKMVCVTWSGVYLYDLDAGESVSDKAMDEFVDAQVKEELKYSDGYYKPLLVIPSKDDVLYLVCEKGIFRHVWGGNLVEQLADGSLNSLSNPSCAISDGMLLEDGTFLIIMGGGLLASYTYDPDMPATPDVQLKAYSLTENERLKKAISMYQAEHPEVYVRYEIGMEGETSVTREDALKKLNTEIAAGTGPDFFLLDDMPIDSYTEKGILADLTPYLEKKAGEDYFQNILRTFEKDGEIPAVPVEFNLPVVGGKEEYVAKMKDLSAIADAAEEYRGQKADGSLFGAAREKTLLKKLMPVCAPVWMEEKGTVEEEALEEFFLQAQRIWNVEKAGVTEEMRKEEEEYYSRLKQEGGRTEEEADELWINNIVNGGRRYMTGEQAFFSGIVDGFFDFDVMNSYFHIEGNEDGGFAEYCGQASGVFVPRTIAGISRTSEKQEAAGGLMEALIDVSWDGLTLNKEETRKNLRINATEDGGSYASMGGGSREDGTYVHFDIYSSSEEEVEHLIQIAEQASVPYIRNQVLEQAVCEAGEKVLKGELDAGEGVREVVKRVSLYMAE